MKTLTVKQPEAALIVLGIKTIENRRWTIAPQRIAIHASKTRINDDDLKFLAAECKDAGIPIPEIHYGAVIGAVTVSRCEKIRGNLSKEEKSWCINDPDATFWVLESPVQVAPIPLRGRLGLFDSPIDVI